MMGCARLTSGKSKIFDLCSAEDRASAASPGLLLLLARICMFMENNALVHVMETLAATFPGQGGSSGSGQPPAFVAGEVGRCYAWHRQSFAAQTSRSIC
jgi:hypothetical protein